MELLSSGWRGEIYIKTINNTKYAIKKAKDDTKKGAIQKEIAILKYLKQKVDFIPKIEDFGDDFFMYKFIEGTTLNKIKNPSIDIYKQLVKYAYILDKLNIEHGELARPTKNIIISPENKVYIIDFERGSLNNKSGKNLKGISKFLLKNKIINLDTIKKLNKEGDLDKIKDYLLSELEN